MAEGSAIIAVCGSGNRARSSAGVRESPEANSTTSWPAAVRPSQRCLTTHSVPP